MNSCNLKMFGPIVLTFLLQSCGTVKTQIQIMGFVDSWADRVNSVMVNVRKLELDVLYFSFPFENKDIDRVQFHLYTEMNPKESQLLSLSETSTIENSNFRKGFPTKILIHGYSQSLERFDFPQQVKDAYLENANNSSHNVICVDWSVLSKEINYFDSANYTSHVGQYIGEFIFELKSAGYIKTFEELHLIGFSLGAHVAGVAGHHIIEKTQNASRIGRITGLDPAQPGFLSAQKMHRLDSQDAQFVDIIHTNMGNLWYGDLGITINSGHADFFPNGGRRQPSCEYSVFTEFSIPRRSTCSHVKAAEYFKKSILGRQYVSCHCSDWDTFQKGYCNCKNQTRSVQEEESSLTLMGEHCDHSARGEYYLFAN